MKNQIVEVHPYTHLEGHSYIRDLAFKSYLDLFYDYEVVDYQYEEENGQVSFVYDVLPEIMGDVVTEWMNSNFRKFKMFEDANRTVVHGIIKPMSGKKRN